MGQGPTAEQKSENLAALQRSREDRLKASQKAFEEAKLADILSKDLALSEGAFLATPNTCDPSHLPPPKHPKRFVVEGDISTNEKRYAICIDRVWNKDTVGFPLAIVRVATPDDVSAAVRFFAKHKTLFSGLCIASGCHSAFSMVDGAFVIDFANMRSIAYDAATQTVEVEAGALLKEVDSELRKHGRLVPVGTNGDTGVAGLTVSGGLGWFMNRHGLTVDSLMGVDLVTATGEIRKGITDESPDETDRDRLWGLRGGGGHFGVITKFVFKTHPIPNDDKMLLATVVAMSPSNANKVQSVLRWHEVCKSHCSAETAGFCVLPQGAPVVPTMWLHTGPKAPEGWKGVSETLKPLTNMGGWVNVKNSWEVVNHARVQSLVADNQGHGHLYQTAVVLTQLNEATAKHVVESIGTAPKGSVLILMPTMANPADPAVVARSSYSLRHGAVWILVESRYDPETDGHVAGRKRCADWCKGFVQSLNAKHPGSMAHTTHAFSDAEVKKSGEAADAMAGTNVAFDGSNEAVVKRLQAIKAKVDPDNLFSANRKIGGGK